MAFHGMFVLPRIPSFGEKLGRSLGEGVSTGVEEFAKLHQRKQEKSYFEKLKGEHPDDERYQLLSDVMGSPIAHEHQSSIVRALLGNRENPLVQKQQQCLDRDSLGKFYSTKIRELDDEIKYGNYSERDALTQQKRALQQERDALFKTLKAHGDDNDLSQMDAEDGNADEDEDFAPRKKVMFNFENPKHIRARDKALKMSKGDRVKAEKMLRRAFDL